MKPWGTSVNYNGKAITLRKLSNQEKSLRISKAALKKDYGFTQKKIDEYETSWVLRYITIWKSKFYKREDILKFL
jgi:hypothetical protein